MKKCALLAVCGVVLFGSAGCLHKTMYLVTPYGEGTGRVADLASAIRAEGRAQRFSTSLEVFNMDLFSHPMESWRDGRARMAVMRAKAFKPDIIFVDGDEGAREFAQRLAGMDYNFIFTGLLGDPADYGFDKSLRVTGVRESLRVKETFALMKQLVPAAKGVAVIADKTLTGDVVIAQIEKAGELPIRIVSIKRAGDVAEWMAAVADAQLKADVLCIASYRGVLTSSEDRKTAIAPSELLRLTAAANKLPDCSFWAEATEGNGVLAAVTTPPAAMGRMAAKKALRILFFDEPISSIRVETCEEQATYINGLRAAKLGIAVPPSVLRRAPVSADQGKSTF